MALSIRRCRVSALLAALIVVDVIALQAVGELPEERGGLLVGGEGGGEIVRDGHLPRGVGDRERDVDGVAALQPGRLSGRRR